MKKIIVGIFTFVLLFTGAQSVSAANWNGAPNDCQNTVAIANYTSNMGYGSCWTSTSMSADAGDTINVRIYYHNTSNVVAKNVRFVINKTSNTSTSHNFSGRIMSDNGDVSGNVNLTISSSQSISFVDARWFPNQSTTQTALPNGQPASNILSSGILIGDVAPSGSAQGTMVAVFKVSNNQPDTICRDTNASNYLGTLPCIPKDTICRDTNASNYLGTLPCIPKDTICRDTNASNYLGSLPCIPKDTICRDTNASNYLGTLPCIPKPIENCTISNFNPSPSTITSGQTSILSWATYNCTSARISIVGLVNTNGNAPVSPTTTTTYILTANSSNGSSDSKNVTVAVTQVQPQLCKDTSASNYNGVVPCVYPPQLCKDTSASNYNSVVPCVYPPQLCKDTSASNYNGVIPCIYPPVIIYCKDANATNYNGLLPCRYPVLLCQDPSASNYRGVLPCDYPVRICQDSSASNYRESLPCIYPPQLCLDSNASNYRGQLPCEYPLRICQDSSAINYRGTLPCRYQSIVNICRDTTANNYGDPLPCNYPVRLCQDYSANNYGYSLPCTYSQPIYNSTPTVSTYVPSNVTNTSATLSGYANGNGTLINSWIEMPCYGVQYGNTYNQSSGNISTLVNSLSPNTTYSYCAATRSVNNSQIYRGNSISFVTTGQVITTPVYTNKNVVTTVATNITQTTASLNGYITNSNYYNSNVYFEYGTTVNLGSRTISKTTNGNTSFSDSVRGLKTNTIYFFRAVGEGSDGASRGAVEVFRTLGNAVVQNQKVIVQQGTTIIGTASPVMLNISNRYELIGQGDLIDYAVIYKNIGKVRLTHPMVQVILPANVSLVNSSRGTYSVDTRTLSVPIEDLNPGQEGTIFLQGQVDSIPLNNSQIATTAILIYTSPNGSQENAMAYVINMPNTQGIVAGNTTTTTTTDLGASAFFAGIMSIGLIGWLLIIVFILILVLIARSYSRNRTSTETVTHTTVTH